MSKNVVLPDGMYWYYNNNNKTFYLIIENESKYNKFEIKTKGKLK